MKARRPKLWILGAVLGALMLMCSGAPALGATQRVVSAFGAEGTGPGQFSFALGAAVEQISGDVLVVDDGADRIQRFTAAGDFLGQFGSAGTGAGELQEPKGIAVEQVTGDVYVSDQGNRRIDEFTATGSFVRAFGWGVENGEAKLQSCTTATSCRAGLEGSGAGELGADVGYPAVDPTNGDLYVADSANKRIDEFTAAGAFVRAFGWGVADGAAKAETCTITCQAGATGSGPAQFGEGSPTRITATPSGDLYVVDPGNDRVQELDASGGLVAERFAFSSLSGYAPSDVAVDPASEAIYIAAQGEDGSQVLELEPNGTLLATAPQGIYLPSAGGLAAGSDGELLYVTPTRVLVLSDTPATAPTATVSAATGVGANTATLHGTVNPQESAANSLQTRYAIQYSTDQANWSTAGEGQLPAGASPMPVSATAEDLIAGTKYYVKVLVERELGAGSAESAIETLSTPYAAPLISGESVSSLGRTEATVSASVDPESLASTYEVEYGTTAAYGSSSPETNLPAATASTPVQVRLSGLQAGTLYHYRFVASNGSGRSSGEAGATFTTQVAVAAGSSELPDHRAYELVSPPEDTEVYVPEEWLGTNPGEITGGQEGGYRAAASGDAIAYLAESPASGVGGIGVTGNGTGNQYLATRGTDGWDASDVSITGKLNAEEEAVVSEVQNISADDSLLTFVMEGDVPANPLAPANCQIHVNTYTLTGSEAHALPTPAGLAPGEPECPYFNSRAGISADDAHLLLESSEGNLYDFASGRLHQVNVLPNGGLDPHPDAEFGGIQELTNPFGRHFQNYTDDVSADGARVFWTDANVEATAENPTGTRRLFVRENDTQPQSPISGGSCANDEDACTLQLDLPEPGCTSCGSGGGEFWLASSDGSAAFFTDEQRLTANATASADEPDLYRYEIGSEGRPGHLVDVSVAAAGHADVREVVGGSDDGSYVYFVADGALTSESNAEGAKPLAGEPNLYLWHEGIVTFVAGAVAAPAVDEGEGMSLTPDEVATSGHAVTFFSSAPLTRYDNHGIDEMFVYEAASQHIFCVSCNPSGEAPVGSAERWEELHPVSEDRGASPSADTYGGPSYLPRWVNETGTEVFFNTNQPLVPQDVNRHQDVYEWEADGSGGCMQTTGCVAAISDVQTPHAARFIDASANGEDVFFTQRVSLVPKAIDETVKLYDARVNGGFPETELACTGTGCQGVPPAPPIFATPASVTFAGVGNFEPAPSLSGKPSAKPKKKPVKCRRGSTKKHGRCVKVKSKGRHANGASHKHNKSKSTKLRGR
jgi:DNA-binding beta-propeller fold protein YncE